MIAGYHPSTYNKSTMSNKNKTGHQQENHTLFYTSIELAIIQNLSITIMPINPKVNRIVKRKRPCHYLASTVIIYPTAATRLVGE